MRKTINEQMQFGEVDISEIKFNPRARDEIPKLLMGLQFIYTNANIRKNVFKILDETLPKTTDRDDGRPGMTLWEILVLGTLRLNCNWDYDKLIEMADNHQTLRQMLGLTIYNRERKYPLQTLKDNILLLSPEVLDQINKVVVETGHTLVKKRTKKMLK